MTATSYRQALTHHDLAIEKGTTRAPDERQYHVIFEGHVIAKYRSLSHARRHFERIKATLNIPSQPHMPLDKQQIGDKLLETVSNKQLLWDAEDFARVQRKTQGKPKRA